MVPMRDAHDVVQSFPIGAITDVRPLGNGRIHKTFLVMTRGETYVLQNIGRLFAPTTHDIDAVTTHLAEGNILTPRLVRTKEGALAVRDGECAWRLFTFVPGTTIEESTNVVQAKSGSAFIAQWHTALSDYTHPFSYRIPQYRDTAYALTHLASVDAAYAHSKKSVSCHPVAKDIACRKNLLADLSALTPRVGHGDLKLNNLRFDEEGTTARALVDLDTLGYYPLPLEIGDMLRSWCRTAINTLESDLWRTVTETYRAHAPFMTNDEWRLIPDGFFEITLSLAARYLADAYEETWFQHDPAYPSRFVQNLERARMNLALLDDFTRHESDIRSIHA